MSDLAVQQQDLLRALFDWPADDATKLIAARASNTWVRGLKAYQTNGHVLAQRALQAAYPVVVQLLGEESLADLARAVWHAYPPARGDLALWAEVLPDYMANSAQLQAEPYLADLARVEWALDRCATAPDALPDAASLALLTTEEPDQLGLRLAPGCAVLRSAWPVASLVAAHVHGTPSLADVGSALRAGVAQDVVVWRQGLQPQFRQALPGEADVLERLLAGSALGPALDQAPDLDFAQWFPSAVASQLVLGVLMQDPAWLTVAYAEAGVLPAPVGDCNSRIRAYHVGTNIEGYDDKVSWCSSFANWCLAQVGQAGTGSALARSWLNWGQPLQAPRVGCIVVLYRDYPTSWKGHVGFFLRADAEQVFLWGGNQLGTVCENAYPLTSVLAYRWPADAANPESA